VKKLGPVPQLRACYEAGPTGYVLYWQLAALGVKCEVIAPTLVRCINRIWFFGSPTTDQGQRSGLRS
jgi:hypothetical protein